MDISRTRRVASLTLGALALAGGGLLISGCGSSADTTPSQAPAAETAAAATPVVYGEGDGTIAVKPNDQFVIQLIAGNGEQWQMTPTGDSIVTMAAQEPGQGASDMTSDRWTFDVTGAGSATLVFTLYDKAGKKGKTVSFDVTSQP